VSTKPFPQNGYRGRFAPSPSGELHFGSLLAAMASYADARSHKGSWLLRIDDIDQARVVNYSDQHILPTLEQCGFEWDEHVTYQSQCIEHYQTALQELNQKQLTYSCDCSRKQLKALSHTDANSHIYPGLCRNKGLTNYNNTAVRINVTDKTIFFTDQIQQYYNQQLSRDVGDFIIYRRDHIFSYQLSVVVDDFYSNISHIVRGYDLLDSTPKQIYLQQLLNYPQPHYAHIPLAVSENNLKLSKLSQAKKVGSDLKTLLLAADFLGQNPARHGLKNHDFSNNNDFWHYLIANWDINTVPKMEKQMIMV